ncbi:DUF4352 domain-containing protein [Brachybacterium paraconglomeratum]|uniref:DUF4352 domain-containing protein n=1 Tax=Brachybacterium paraconglomeratum TaxID=173362 RepID=UPI0028832EF6|nr:DUF4352 domain-containing protein [Brachybacterium paraconglomeratum]
MSTPYGMPPTPPTGGPPLPPAKSRTPLYIALACGCALVLLLVLGGAGLGFYLLGQDGGEEPTSPPSSIVDPPPSEDPSDDPTDDPSSPTSEAPTEIETDQPVDKPTEGPSADATSPSDEIFTLTVSKPEEGTTLELGGETKTPENDKFIGVAVTIENSSSTSIGLDTDRFRLYDDSGTEINIRYGAFSTSGPEIPAGEEAEAQLYADVPEDTVLAEISYTDEVGTGGQEFRVPVGG